VYNCPVNTLRRYRKPALAVLGVVAATAVIELWMGRSPLGPDGRFGWWEPSVWSDENSQRVADAYTFSHIAHGLIFYWFLWLVARKLSVRARLVWAAVIEAGWEILENSPIIIDRYRAVTISIGYVGDSVLNSSMDVVFACSGFLFAWKFPAWASVALILVMEIGCFLWVRDNLTLNVIMLVYPLESIKAWQSAGAPVSLGI
jgi:hypothetical protein